MFNYLMQRHITHLLLIDTESVETMRTLVRNAADLCRRFCEIAGTSTYDKYTLVLVFPKSRTDLAKPAAELESEMKQLGAECHVYAVDDADMFLVRGKAGLLSCSLWAIKGAILVNDVPIPPENAELVLSLANRSEGIYPLGNGQHAAIIGSATSIGPSLHWLREDHDLSDLLDALSAGPTILERYKRHILEINQDSGSHRSESTCKKKWWQFWK